MKRQTHNRSFDSFYSQTIVDRPTSKLKDQAPKQFLYLGRKNIQAGKIIWPAATAQIIFLEQVLHCAINNLMFILIFFFTMNQSEINVINTKGKCTDIQYYFLVSIMKTFVQLICVCYNFTGLEVLHDGPIFFDIVCRQERWQLCNHRRKEETKTIISKPLHRSYCNKATAK